MSSQKKMLFLVVAGIAAIVLLIVSLVTLRVKTISGNELGVRESWSQGVDPEPLLPGTHFLFPGWTQTVYVYDMGYQIFKMTDSPDDPNKDKAVARDADAYHVQSAEGQDMAISVSVQWRRNPDKLIYLHQKSRHNTEEIIVRPIVQRVLKDEATVRKAIDAYSGEGLVKLQRDIERDLGDQKGELFERGIIVDNFVIESIKLDDNYIGEIRGRQVASQKKLRSDEETKASEALALKAKADAQADFNKRVVEAERDQKVAVLKAEQEAKASIIAAEASAKQVELSAKAEKEASMLKAQAIEALGRADAEAMKLKLTAYAAPGAENFTRIEVAKQLAASMWSVKGFLPSDMTVNVISENFMQSLQAFLGGGAQQKK